MTLLAGLPSSGSQESYLGWGRGRSPKYFGRGRYRLSPVDHPSLGPPATTANHSVKRAEVRQCSKCLSWRVSGLAFPRTRSVQVIFNDTSDEFVTLRIKAFAAIVFPS